MIRKNGGKNPSCRFSCHFFDRWMARSVHPGGKTRSFASILAQSRRVGTRDEGKPGNQSMGT